MNTAQSAAITNLKFVQVKFKHSYNSGLFSFGTYASSSPSSTMAGHECVSSPIFTVAGQEWRIRYHPRRHQVSYKTPRMSSFCEPPSMADLDGTPRIGLYLELCSSVAKEIKLSFEFQPLDKNGATSAARNKKAEHSFKNKTDCGGWSDFATIADIEANCVADGYLVLNCYFGILCSAERDVPKNCSVVVPPSNLAEHLEKLLDSDDEERDVTFIVAEEEIHAHRLVLAARSPVFKALLSGKMAETSMRHIAIEDMNASTFKVMLKFIYTDLLPEDREFIGPNAENVTEASINMYQHLFSAADRFGLERLKLICEDKLSKSMSSDMVGTTLALAEQHNCHNLKALCLEFLTTTENLKAVIPTDGFVHLIQSCPSILLDLNEKLGDESDLLAIVIMFEKLARRIQNV